MRSRETQASNHAGKNMSLLVVEWTKTSELRLYNWGIGENSWDESEFATLSYSLEGSIVPANDCRFFCSAGSCFHASCSTSDTLKTQSQFSETFQKKTCLPGTINKNSPPPINYHPKSIQTFFRKNKKTAGVPPEKNGSFEAHRCSRLVPIRDACLGWPIPRAKLRGFKGPPAARTCKHYNSFRARW